MHIENCEQWKLAAGGVIEAEYDVDIFEDGIVNHVGEIYEKIQNS